MCLWDSCGERNQSTYAYRSLLLALRVPLLTLFHDKGEEMTYLDKTLDKLEEEEKILKDKLISAWEKSRYVDRRLLLVCGLLGKVKN